MTHEPKEPESGACLTLSVPEDVCYLRFVEDYKGYDGSKELGFTSRGECIIADFDKDGNIIGLELFSLSKPCQK